MVSSIIFALEVWHSRNRMQTRQFSEKAIRPPNANTIIRRYRWRQFSTLLFYVFFFLVLLTHGMVLFVQHKSTVINHFAKFIICWTLLPAISQREALSFSPALYSMVTNCREPNLTSDANRIFDRFFSHHFVVVPALRAHLSSICLRSAAAQQCPYLANRIFCVREHSSPKFTRY